MGNATRNLPLFLGSIVDFFLSPARTDLVVPPGTSPSYIQVRERILTVMMRMAALLGLVAMLQSIPDFLSVGRTDLILAYGVPLVMLWVLALGRRIDYRLRGGIFLLLQYGMSVVELINYGDSVESHEYLFAFTIFATVFLGTKAGSLAFVSSLATLGVFVWLMGTGQYVPPEMATLYAKMPSLGYLVGAWLTFLMIVGAANIGLFILVNSLNQAWQREHQAVGLLQQERDLLEQRVAERTRDLAEARDQALGASRYKTELMAKVNHELRAPLGAILGYTELLHNGLLGPITPKQKGTTARVLVNTYHLTDMVNDLLDQAQIERGQIQLHVAPFHPRDMSEGINTTMKLMAEAKGLSFTIYVAPELPAVLLGDQKRLKQILTNLISNAIKFTETGRVEAHLDCAGTEHWAMKVSDTGPGIPLEAQTHIFESFWQVDNPLTRKQHGYGLGLSIVKQLTELMGGRITLESEAGRGSTFSIVLPLKAKPEGETPVPGRLKDELEPDNRQESL